MGKLERQINDDKKDVKNFAKNPQQKLKETKNIKKDSTNKKMVNLFIIIKKPLRFAHLINHAINLNKGILVVFVNFTKNAVQVKY